MGLFRKKRKPKYVEEILEFDETRQKEKNETVSEAPVQKRKNPAMEFCSQIRHQKHCRKRKEIIKLSQII